MYKLILLSLLFVFPLQISCSFLYSKKITHGAPSVDNIPINMDSLVINTSPPVVHRLKATATDSGIREAMKVIQELDQQVVDEVASWALDAASFSTKNFRFSIVSGIAELKALSITCEKIGNNVSMSIIGANASVSISPQKKIVVKKKKIAGITVSKKTYDEVSYEPRELTASEHATLLEKMSEKLKTVIESQLPKSEL